MSFVQGPNLQSMFGSLLGGSMGGMGGLGGLGSMAGGVGGGAAGVPDMSSFFNNPSLMNMVCLYREKKRIEMLSVFYL